MRMKLFQLIQEVGEKNPTPFQYFRKFQISVILNIAITFPKDYCHKIRF